MSPLYPLLAPDIFSPSHLSILTTSESILLCAMITIAARYSSVLPRPRSNQIHILCANFIRQQLIYLHEGSPSSRHISSVEALLLLTEWPSTPLVHAAKVDEGKDVNDEEVTELLKASSQYDSMSWTYIGACHGRGIDIKELLIDVLLQAVLCDWHKSSALITPQCTSLTGAIRRGTCPSPGTPSGF